MASFPIFPFFFLLVLRLNQRAAFHRTPSLLLLSNRKICECHFCFCSASPVNTFFLSRLSDKFFFFCLKTLRHTFSVVKKETQNKKETHTQREEGGKDALMPRCLVLFLFTLQFFFFFSVLRATPATQAHIHKDPDTLVSVQHATTTHLIKKRECLTRNTYACVCAMPKKRTKEAVSSSEERSVNISQKKRKNMWREKRESRTVAHHERTSTTPTTGKLGRKKMFAPFFFFALISSHYSFLFFFFS